MALLPFAILITLAVNCNCLRLIRPQGKVVRGELVNITEVPHMACIVLLYPKPQDVFEIEYAGAVLIKRNFVLTAAHVLIDDLNKPPKDQPVRKVILGVDDLTQEGFVFNIVRFECHHRYKPLEFTNDIAIAKLNMKAPLSRQIRPIDLPRPDEEKKFHEEGLFVYTSGWGDTVDPDDPFNRMKLRMLGLTLLSDKTCRQSKIYRMRSQICAYKYEDSINPHGGGICNGDSGSGLFGVRPKDESVVLLGIVSFFAGPCQDQISFYTRVSHYVPWIQSRIRKFKLSS